MGESVNDYKRSAAVFLLVCLYLVFHVLVPPFVYPQVIPQVIAVYLYCMVHN